ncbi:MAG: hypothetical protein WB995_05360, partial [Candidatus Acidiferrales bacterium]
MSAANRVLSIARIAIALAAFLGFMAIVFAPAPVAAQSAPVERTFKNSKDVVEAAVKDLHTSASGRLPVLDGFVEPPDESLDR